MTPLQQNTLRDIVYAAIRLGAECEKRKSFTVADPGQPARSVFDVATESAIKLMEKVLHE